MDKRFLLCLNSTVFVTGAAVLVIEVAAVRVLAPYYGSSLYVFSSVITVVLGALSFGYYFGGRLADRYPTPRLLYGIITLSGVLVLCMEFLSRTVLPVGTQIFSVMSGPLIFSTMLFFTPALLLGIVSPYIIKLLSLHATGEYTGRLAGATFFFGTLGSIVGSLSTGFLLIPFLGIHLSIMSTGLILVVLGLIGGVYSAFVTSIRGSETIYTLVYKDRIYLLSVVALTLFSLFLLRVSAFYAHAETLVYQEDTQYSHVAVHERVLDGKKVRLLKNDTNYSSATAVGSYDLLFGYTQFAEFYPELKPDTSKYLILGGGSYSIPRSLVARNADMQVDVVDIDPRLFLLAQEYFDVKDLSRITSYAEDARMFFIQHDTAIYDVIFEDVFNTDLSIPFHLSTKEFYSELKTHLLPNGILLINYVGALRGDAPTMTGSLYKTLKSVFPNLKMYAFETENPEELQNIVFIARNGSEPIVLDPEKIMTNVYSEHTIAEMEVYEDVFNLNNEIILTDDHAPVEYLMLKQL